MKKEFGITDGKGFHITFSNGITLSVQFGFGNYCDNRMNNNANVYMDKSLRNIESETCEIAIWNKKGKWITKKFGFKNDVEGWVSPDKLAIIIDKIIDRNKEE